MPIPIRFPLTGTPDEQARQPEAGQPARFVQLPNAFIDELLPDISTLAELKVTLAVIRQTIGWHRPADIISHSQLERITGLGRQGVSDGLKRALARGLITRHAAGNSYAYRWQGAAAPGEPAAPTADSLHITPAESGTQPPWKPDQFDPQPTAGLQPRLTESEFHPPRSADWFDPQPTAGLISRLRESALQPPGGGDQFDPQPGSSLELRPGSVSKADSQNTGNTQRQATDRAPLRGTSPGEGAESELGASPTFEVIARGSFDVTDAEGMDAHRGRIGRLVKGLRRLEPKLNAASLEAFYAWYRVERPGYHPPRDPTKFEEHWLRFRASGGKHRGDLAHRPAPAHHPRPTIPPPTPAGRPAFRSRTSRRAASGCEAAPGPPGAQPRTRAGVVVAW